MPWGKVPVQGRTLLLVEGPDRFVLHFSVTDDQNVVFCLIDKILHFPLIQKGRQLSDGLRFQIHRPEDFAFFHVKQDRPVRRDHRQLQFHIRQQFSHRSGGLDCRHREVTAILDQAVQFDLRVAGDFLPNAENRILNARDVERIRIPQSRQMGPVYDLCRRNADDGVHGPVKHEDIRICIPDVVDGDGEKDDR